MNHHNPILLFATAYTQKIIMLYFISVVITY